MLQLLIVYIVFMLLKGDKDSHSDRYNDGYDDGYDDGYSNRDDEY